MINSVVYACLTAKQPFVIDNASVTRNERARYSAAAKVAHIRVLGYYFQSTILDSWSASADEMDHNAFQRKASLAPTNAHTHLRLMKGLMSYNL